jgi:hypothetical protein
MRQLPGSTVGYTQSTPQKYKVRYAAGVDEARSAALDEIRKSKRRPVSNWEKVLYSKPFQPVQVEVR